jgi:hypothetical protein
MLIARNQDPFRFGVGSSKSVAASAEGLPVSGDSVTLGQSRPTPLTYVPTGAGTAALGATMVGVGTGVGMLLNALSGHSGVAIAGGMLSGLAASFLVGASMDKGAETAYAETGQGSTWLRPVFTPEEITGLPRQPIGVRGLF